MTSAWYQVSCEIPATMAESVADYLTELSNCGVCTDNRNVDTFSTDDIPGLSSSTVTSYFSVPCPIEDRLASLEAFLYSQQEIFPEYKHVPPTVQMIAEEDWATSWKDLFKPMPVGHNLLITPSWIPCDDNEKRIAITIDPGMAFGTGGHETTRLCLECLENIITGNPVFTASEQDKQLPVLDLGTGSGVLAIAAAKLGVKRIDAVDIDPQAVTVARENCELNGVSEKITCATTPIEQLGGGYGLILANILAEELVRLAPSILKRLTNSGHLVLSGILAERESLVTDCFNSLQMKLEASLAAGEWRCLHYRKSR